MAKGSPSLVALLGLLAVAGYQNRDKLSAMVRSRQDENGMWRADEPATSGGGVIDNLRGMLTGTGTGTGTGGIVAGLQELLGRFTTPVQSAKAQSWVDTGPNGALGTDDLAAVLDDETLAELTQKTGLSREELLQRLSTTLPDAVDRMTPQGRLPAEGETVSL